MKARTDTKEKIVELGTNLLQTVGYPSLSYQQISSKLGIKNAAIHYHYPGKEDLGVDIIRNDQATFEKFIADMSGLDHWGKLEAFLSSYRGNLENGNKLCIIGSSASDYSALPQSMQEASAVYLTLVKNWFISLLKTGREEGSFHFKGEPENMAALIVSGLAGALQHARLIGDGHYDTVVTQIKFLIKK